MKFIDLSHPMRHGQTSFPGDPVLSHMSAPLPFLGVSQPLATAVGVLNQHPAALVTDRGKSKDILTRQDLLGFLTHVG